MVNDKTLAGMADGTEFPPTSSSVDALIVGAGFSGLYALHRFRALGLDVRVLEAGPSVGGTWYWNRYPGARCDAQSLVYCYMFDKALHRKWRWSERYATGGEIQRYLEFVADELDLRRDIRFDTRVIAASFDEASATWNVTTNSGERMSARWLIMATGALSVGRLPDIPGIERFAGDYYHTSSWPEDGVDLRGKRVGVVGTGSSGVQVIPMIAAQAAHLTVFQRTPGFVAPARNRPIEAEENEAFLEDFEDIRGRMRRGEMVGTGDVMAPKDFPATRPTSEGVDPEEAEALMRFRWELGGVTINRTFADTMTNPKSNALIADFFRARIRETVMDPVVAEKLVPKGYPFGAKRICVGTDYYETYNRKNVTLVDVNETPIVEITPSGVRTSAEELPLDVLVFATGFDALTGALANIDIAGRGGRRLADSWADGPKTYLGIAVSGFPNMFIVTGPGSPSALSTVTTSIEQHIDWLHDLLAAANRDGIGTIEALPEAQAAWTQEVAAAAAGTLFTKARSWYMGDNVPGKPRVFLVYAGGVGRYRERCDAVAAQGYTGFRLEERPVIGDRTAGEATDAEA